MCDLTRAGDRPCLHLQRPRTNSKIGMEARSDGTVSRAPRALSLALGKESASLVRPKRSLSRTSTNACAAIEFTFSCARQRIHGSASFEGSVCSAAGFHLTACLSLRCSVTRSATARAMTETSSVSTTTGTVTQRTSHPGCGRLLRTLTELRVSPATKMHPEK